MYRTLAESKIRFVNSILFCLLDFYRRAEDRCWISYMGYITRKFQRLDVVII